jgi:hypothetical protein
MKYEKVWLGLLGSIALGIWIILLLFSSVIRDRNYRATDNELKVSTSSYSFPNELGIYYKPRSQPAPREIGEQFKNAGWDYHSLPVEITNDTLVVVFADR